MLSWICNYKVPNTSNVQHSGPQKSTLKRLISIIHLTTITQNCVHLCSNKLINYV